MPQDAKVTDDRAGQFLHKALGGHVRVCLANITANEPESGAAMRPLLLQTNRVDREKGTSE